MSQWIGFDLDGTLAHHGEGEWDGGVGRPIKPMIDILKNYIAEGVECRIVTARVASCHPEQERYDQTVIVREWIKEQVGRELPVTSEKDFEMVVLYDDRAIQVEKNTGRLVSNVVV